MASIEAEQKPGGLYHQKLEWSAGNSSIQTRITVTKTVTNASNSVAKRPWFTNTRVRHFLMCILLTKQISCGLATSDETPRANNRQKSIGQSFSDNIDVIISFKLAETYRVFLPLET